jgi:hypothetical protein
MKIRVKVRTIVIGFSLLAACLLVDGGFHSGIVVSEAEARVGRPATPGSVAGVGRRTTRRRIYRTNRYIATLPKGCQTVVIEGTTLHQCGGTYYQSSSGQYEVVNVD